MKNGPLFFLGLFLALVISWTSIVLGTQAQLGALAPYFDETEGAQPSRAPGVAARGQLVYADLGCAACHTQQVRRPGFGADVERGWGERQSVARDYIFQARPQLGASRLGPDLANLAGRKPPYDAEDLYKLLYQGSAAHPSYKFLFADREIVGERATDALKVSGIAPGRQVVPTERARTLVAYLLGSSQGYVFPEAKPLPPQKKDPAPKAKTAPPKEHDVKPIPAAPPDEKKKSEAKK